jgi:histidinol-phosphate phosphatase family protein
VIDTVTQAISREPLPSRLLRGRPPYPIATLVLFDRDGTLIADVPFNADPALVVPMPGARAAMDRLREAGVPTAIVTNQSGVALGRIGPGDVAAINARTEELLGPLGPTFVCAHAPADGCACRKPAPALIERAARAFGVEPGECVMIGDIGADVEAATRAGARSILVPTSVTRSAEIEAAPFVAANLSEAVDAVLGGLV